MHASLLPDFFKYTKSIDDLFDVVQVSDTTMLSHVLMPVP